MTAPATKCLFAGSSVVERAILRDSEVGGSIPSPRSKYRANHLYEVYPASRAVPSSMTMNTLSGR